MNTYLTETRSQYEIVYSRMGLDIFVAEVTLEGIVEMEFMADSMMGARLQVAEYFENFIYNQ